MLKMFIYKYVHSVLSDTNTSSPLAHCTSGSGSSFWEWAYSYFFSPKYNLTPTKEALVFPWKKISRAVIYNLKGFFVVVIVLFVWFL